MNLSDKKFYIFLVSLLFLCIQVAIRYFITAIEILQSITEDLMKNLAFVTRRKSILATGHNLGKVRCAITL